MRRVQARALLAAATLALLASLLTAAPAHAAIVACSGHIEVAEYVTAGGNRYELNVHLCLDDTGSDINTRAHWHCQRNDAAWDGCRLNARLAVQFLNDTWQNAPSSYKDVSPPGGTASCLGSGQSNGGFFTDSATYTSNIIISNTLVRAYATDPDNVRFCLADGTSVLDDIGVNAVGPQHQA